MDHSEPLLQDALDNVDWEMFRESSDDVGEFAEVIGSYVNLLYCETTQAVKIKVFPNQKPWVDRTVKAVLKAQTAAYFRRHD